MKHISLSPIASASTAAATATALWLAVRPERQSARLSPARRIPGHLVGDRDHAQRDRLGRVHQGRRQPCGRQGRHVRVLERHVQGRALQGHRQADAEPEDLPLQRTIHGTIALSGGTGAYKGISGKGPTSSTSWQSWPRSAASAR